MIAEKAYDGKVVADGAAIKQEDAWAVANKAEAGAIWDKEMNENNAVPTTGVSQTDVE